MEAESRFRRARRCTRVRLPASLRPSLPAVRLRRACGALVLALVATTVASLPSPAATSSSVVGATVVSSTSLDRDGCRSGVAGSTLLGNLTAGTGVVSSSDCRIVFGSSNDTTKLVASQADGTGTAMASPDVTLTRSSDGQRMYDVDMSSPTDALAVGQQGALRRWNGATWSTLASGSSAAFLGVSASAAPALWVTTSSGGIRGSSNDGSTWSPQYTAAGALNDVDAASATVAWAVGDGGAVAATTNGTSWTAQTSNVTAHLKRIEALSTTSAVAVGFGGKVIHTTNGGSTWTPIAAGVSYDLYGLAGNASWLVAAGSGGAIQSTDGGTTWTPLTGMPSSSWLAVAVQGPGTVLLFGDTGELYRTTDGGTTWARIDTVWDNDYRSATQFGGTFVASGDGAQLLVSSNAGTSWTPSPEYLPNLYGMYADGRDEAWAVGSGGTIRHTTDGGATFTNQSSGTSATLVEMTGSGPLRLWAVGETGAIVSSNDGGASWTPRTSGVGVRLRAVEAADENTVWAAGSSGTILRSTNGGASWSAATLGTQALSSVAAGSTQVAWVGGSGQYVARTINGGTTWTPVTVPAGMNGDVIRVAGASSDGQRVVIGGSSTGLVYRTSNAGASWTAISAFSNSTVADLAASDDGAIAVATGFTVMATFDGGLTAITAPGGNPTRSAKGLAMSSSHAIWVAGDSYTIAHLDTGSATVPDFSDDVANSSGSDWGTAGASFFGACLRALTSATADTWAVDADATCTASDTDPWRAIPASRAAPGAVVAHTTTPGASASADLRFGFRVGATLPTGGYTASVRFEVIAP